MKKLCLPPWEPLECFKQHEVAKQHKQAWKLIFPSSFKSLLLVIEQVFQHNYNIKVMMHGQNWWQNTIKSDVSVCITVDTQLLTFVVGFPIPLLYPKMPPFMTF